MLISVSRARNEQSPLAQRSIKIVVAAVVVLLLLVVVVFAVRVFLCFDFWWRLLGRAWLSVLGLGLIRNSKS